MLTATGITGRSGAFPPHHFVSYSGEYLSKVLECTRGYLTYGLRGQQSQIRDPPKALRAGWTPTDLAQELDKSRNTVYNHLESLYDQGVLTKTQVAAKTRPKTEYSIEDGFMQYIAVLPGHYTEKSLELTPEKQTVLRTWSVPQEEFQPYIESYWRSVKNEIDYRGEIKAVAVYGSVARGQPDEDSDIDFLLITDEESEDLISDRFGSIRVEAEDSSKNLHNSDLLAGRVQKQPCSRQRLPQKHSKGTSQHLRPR
jgi:predicted nucleotidyltransferase/DNA-binding transcriptional ArsR family regulator